MVFIASPTELKKEREIVRNVCAELNANVAPFRAVTLDAVGWESHCWPDVGTDPQAVVFSQIQPSDIFVGILWNRFGTPTPRADSGTAEEFAVAYESWQTKNVSNLLFYFKKQSLTEDLEQIKLVQDFRNNLSVRGVMYWNFSSRAEFERQIRQHLTNIVLRREPVETAGAIPGNKPELVLLPSVDLLQLTRELDAQLLIRGKLSLIYIDLDDFGRLNDTIGIRRSDVLLDQIGKGILETCTERGLKIRRVLGDQFAVFIKRQNKTEVIEVAEELRLQIRKSTTPKITASIGVAFNTGADAESLVMAARYASHLAKRRGKDCVTSIESREEVKINSSDLESS